MLTNLRTSRIGIWFLIFGIFIQSCIRPSKKFEAYTPPPPPDYTKTECWAALPDKFDSADVIVPHSSCKNGEADAKVDVFFIHPTSYSKRKSWNADWRDEHLNKKTDKGTIKFQASVFNETCRIYAPRYRQATLDAFMDTLEGKKAIAFAYEDVKVAFQYYLDHYNNGRPIIIASHSQGTWHAIKLLHDFFDDDPVLRKKLVAAYLVGGWPDAHEYKNIPAGDSSGQTGCYMGWRTFVWGVKPNKYEPKKNILCTNPLTWKQDKEYAGKEKNLGGLPLSFKRIDKNVCDAQRYGNYLWAHRPKVPGYVALAGNYHIDDYGLFYMNIRENVALRVKNYLAKQ